MARFYEHGPALDISASLLRQFEAEVDKWYHVIPVKVEFVPGQPYVTMGQMRLDCELNRSHAHLAIPWQGSRTGVPSALSRGT